MQRRHHDGPVVVQCGIDPLQIPNLRLIVDDDVKTVWIVDQIILMIALGGIERGQPIHAGDDRTGEGMGLLKLGDIGVCNATKVGNQPVCNATDWRTEFGPVFTF